MKARYLNDLIKVLLLCISISLCQAKAQQPDTTKQPDNTKKTTAHQKKQKKKAEVQLLIKFDDAGKAISPIPTLDSIQLPNPNQLSKEQIKSLSKKLLLAVSNALDNIQDENIGTNKLIINLWGNPVYDSMKRELDILKKFFSTDDYKSFNNAPAFTYFPAPKFFIDIYESKNIFSIPKTEVSKGIKTTNLNFTDPFQSAFFTLYNDLFKACRVDTLEMGIKYKEGWRELEKLYADINNNIQILYNHANDSSFCCSDSLKDIQTNFASTSIQNKLNNNTIVKMLKAHDSFFDKWFWITNGLFTMNPIFATTDDKVYPTSEQYRFRDTLTVLLAKQHLTAKSLDEIQQIRKIANSVKRPVDKGIETINYDASNDYQVNNDNRPTVVTEDKKYTICVDNVPQNTFIKNDFSKQPILDNSKFVQSFSALDSSIGALISIVAGVASPFTTSLSPLFNKPAFTPSNSVVGLPNISAFIGLTNTTDDKETLDKASPNIRTFFEKSFSPKTNQIKTKSYENSLKTFNQGIAPKTFIIYLNGKRIPLLGNIEADKITIIQNYLCNCCCLNNSEINQFINNDTCYGIVYPTDDDILEEDGKELLKKSVSDLILRFNNYEKKICNEKINELANSLKKDAKTVESYLKIYDRSLPPAKLEANDDKNPLLRTEIKPIPIEAPNKITYTISAGSIKAGTKDTSFSTVENYSFKTGKRYFLQFSAGIAFTIPDYTKNIVTTTSTGQLNVVNDNDKVRMVAGIHLYPLGLFQQNNRFLGGPFDKNCKARNGSNIWNNLSIFLGLGIPKPLENYYVGGSLDVVPGLRIISGVHYFKYTNYTIFNNQIINQKSKPDPAGLFVSLNLDPATFGKTIGLFK